MGLRLAGYVAVAAVALSTAGAPALADFPRALNLTVDSPPSVYLPNSGQPGVDFDIGGSITLDSGIATGTYVGAFEVTADYQ